MYLITEFTRLCKEAMWWPINLLGPETIYGDSEATEACCSVIAEELARGDRGRLSLSRAKEGVECSPSQADPENKVKIKHR